MSKFTSFIIHIAVFIIIQLDFSLSLTRHGRMNLFLILRYMVRPLFWTSKTMSWYKWNKKKCVTPRRFAFSERNQTECVVIVIDRTSDETFRQWGENLFHHPHGIKAASNGETFVTDSHLHQVFKLVCSSHTFQNLNFYVADGCGNTRVVTFDRCGNYLLEFTVGTTDPTIPIIPFNIVHKLIVAIRHNPTANRAIRRSNNNQDDRNNCRIHYFSGNGLFLYDQTCEHLGIPNTWLMSVAHLDVNPRDAPYNVNFDADFGIIYASDQGCDTVSPHVVEIAIGWSNASVISRFSTNSSGAFARRGSAHDLTVSKNGEEVYVVVPNSTTLVVKRFQMKVASSATRNLYVSCAFVLTAAYLHILSKI